MPGPFDQPPSTIPIDVVPPPPKLPETVITQGTVPSLPPLEYENNVYDDGTQLGYIGWGCTINYTGDMGLRPQPLAGLPAVTTPGSGTLGLYPAGATCDIVRVHAGMCYKVVTCVATRMGVKPTLPSFRTNTPNDVLLFWNVGSFSPPPLIDGSQLFGIVAQYTFVLQRPPDLQTDSLDMGAFPFTVFPAYQNVLRPSDYVDYLLGPAQPVSNMPGTAINY